MRRFLWLCLGLGGALAGWLYLQPPSTTPRLSTPAPAELKATAPLDALTYQLRLNTSIQSPDAPSQTIHVEGLLQLQRQAQRWQGLFVQGQLQLGQQSQALPELPFWLQWQATEVPQLDLLGLAADHPLQSLRFIWPQLSYHPRHPLQIPLANASHHYRYQQQGRTVQRQLIERQTQPSQASSNYQERWQLTLADDGYPAHLSYQSDTLYQPNEQGVKVQQQIQLQRITRPLAAGHHQWLAQQNQGLRWQDRLPPPAELHSMTELLAAIEQLTSQQDEQLAVLVGQYVLAKLSVAELASLLQQWPASTMHASRLIYAIQKAGGVKAEQMFEQLLQQPQVSELNQQRVVMSLGRLEQASPLAVDILQQQSRIQGPLQATAWLSLGSLSQFSPDVATQVEAILEQQWQQAPLNQAQVLALANTGSHRFDARLQQDFARLDGAAQQAAVQVLADDARNDGWLVGQLLQQQNPSQLQRYITQLAERNAPLAAQHRQQIARQLPLVKDETLKALWQQLLEPTDDW